MSTKQITKAEQKRQATAEAIEELRVLFPFGDTVYTVLRSVSRSGMSRAISVMTVDAGEIRNVSHLVARALDYRMDPYSNHNALKVNGAGMDMGYHVAHNLSRVLHGDGYALPHRWV